MKKMLSKMNMRAAMIIALATMTIMTGQPVWADSGTTTVTNWAGAQGVWNNVYTMNSKRTVPSELKNENRCSFFSLNRNFALSLQPE